MTPPEPESDDVPDEEWLEESLLKKLERDDHREPLLPLEEPWLLLVQVVVVCAGAAAPGGGGGSQCWRGISV